jgi:DNA-binding LacI/PurR family transcriptional regulator
VAVLAPRSAIGPTSGWTYYGDMVDGIRRRAGRLGVTANVMAVEDLWLPGPGPGWPRLKEHQAFVVVERDDHALIHQLDRLRRGPVVVADAYYRDLPVIGVVDGSFDGARRAVNHLIGLGHRRIAHLSPRQTAEVVHDKTCGYEAALAEAGIPLDPSLVAFPTREDMAGSIRTAVEGFLALPDPPTAIFAGTDDRALPAIRVLETLGSRVGEDFAVVGFGDQAFRLGLYDRLTSVRINTRQMGEAAVEAALSSRILTEGRILIVPDRLIVRSSSGTRRHESRAAGGARDGSKG